MFVPEHAREMPVGRYREISGLSRDLVGRAVVLDGGAPVSGALGPVTLFQKCVVKEALRVRKRLSTFPGVTGGWNQRILWKSNNKLC